ncbi:MAG: hypothetical protein ABIY46_07265, partial [Gemmatimonadales bacterium]
MATATLDRQEIFQLARLGAEARLRALEAERALLLRTFPGLRAGAAPASKSAVPQNEAPVRRR